MSDMRPTEPRDSDARIQPPALLGRNAARGNLDQESAPPPLLPANSLEGETARELQPPPLFRAFLLILFPIVLLTGIVAGIRDIVALAFLPLLVGMSFWFFRRRPLVLRFEEEGVHLNRAPSFVSHDEVREIYTSGAKTESAFAIHLCLDQGEVILPAKMDRLPQDIFGYLNSVCPRKSRPTTVPRELQGFRDGQARIFGAETVLIFRPRSLLSTPMGIGAWGAFFHGCTATGLVWIAGGSWWGVGWFRGGIVLAIVSGLFALLVWIGQRRKYVHVVQAEKSCLVLSPGGMAMIQEPMRGELKWSEVMDIKMTSGTVEIRVQGAKIRIADIYQASAQRIFRTMRELWLAGDIRKR